MVTGTISPWIVSHVGTFFVYGCWTELALKALLVIYLHVAFYARFYQSHFLNTSVQWWWSYKVGCWPVGELTAGAGRGSWPWVLTVGVYQLEIGLEEAVWTASVATTCRTLNLFCSLVRLHYLHFPTSYHTVEASSFCVWALVTWVRYTIWKNTHTRGYWGGPTSKWPLFTYTRRNYFVYNLFTWY